MMPLQHHEVSFVGMLQLCCSIKLREVKLGSLDGAGIALMRVGMVNRGRLASDSNVWVLLSEMVDWSL